MRSGAGNATSARARFSEPEKSKVGATPGFAGVAPIGDRARRQRDFETRAARRRRSAGPATWRQATSPNRRRRRARRPATPRGSEAQTRRSMVWDLAECPVRAHAFFLLTAPLRGVTCPLMKRPAGPPIEHSYEGKVLIATPSLRDGVFDAHRRLYVRASQRRRDGHRRQPARRRNADVEAAGAARNRRRGRRDPPAAAGRRRQRAARRPGRHRPRLRAAFGRLFGERLHGARSTTTSA